MAKLYFYKRSNQEKSGKIILLQTSILIASILSLYRKKIKYLIFAKKIIS